MEKIKLSKEFGKSTLYIFKNLNQNTSSRWCILFLSLDDFSFRIYNETFYNYLSFCKNSNLNIIFIEYKISINFKPLLSISSEIKKTLQWINNTVKIDYLITYSNYWGTVFLSENAKFLNSLYKKIVFIYDSAFFSYTTALSRKNFISKIIAGIFLKCNFDIIITKKILKNTAPQIICNNGILFSENNKKTPKIFNTKELHNETTLSYFLFNILKNYSIIVFLKLVFFKIPNSSINIFLKNTYEKNNASHLSNIQIIITNLIEPTIL